MKKYWVFAVALLFAVSCGKYHVKNEINNGSALGKLKAHKVKYPTLAICSTEEELYALPLHDPSINLVGVELIALDEDSAWFDPDVVDALRAESLLIWVNSETLTTGVPLFAGFDDEKALVGRCIHLSLTRMDEPAA